MKLDDLELDNCKLIKIDIEGHEWEAIQGGQKLLKMHRPIIYMEAKNQVKGTEKCLKWLKLNEKGGGKNGKSFTELYKIKKSEISEQFA